MLVLVLLTMMMGGAVLLSASLFYLNSNPTHQGACKIGAQKHIGDVVYDDVEFPQLGEPGKTGTETQYSTQLLDFTRTTHKSANQLPLLGMPDKAFYHIH